jgi:hypothetical protein
MLHGCLRLGLSVPKTFETTRNRQPPEDWCFIRECAVFLTPRPCSTFAHPLSISIFSVEQEGICGRGTGESGGPTRIATRSMGPMDSASASFYLPARKQGEHSSLGQLSTPSCMRWSVADLRGMPSLPRETLASELIGYEPPPTRVGPWRSNASRSFESCYTGRAPWQSAWRRPPT